MEEVPLTIGETYAIVAEWTDFEGDVVYEILGDDGEPRTYTKFPDKDGLSYATWFAAIIEEDVN